MKIAMPMASLKPLRKIAPRSTSVTSTSRPCKKDGTRGFSNSVKSTMKSVAKGESAPAASAAMPGMYPRVEKWSTPVRHTTCHQGCCSRRPSLASGPGTSSTISASNQRLSRSVGAFGKTSDLDTTPPPKPGDNDRDASGKIPIRAPDRPPSLAPARLAVGFGPKELSPTLARRGQLAIHPADLSEKVRVGPPPPGATRRLGVFLASYCHSAVYASRARLSTFSTVLFTGVRRRRILRSSPCGDLRRSSDGLLGGTLTTIASKLSV